MEGADKDIRTDEGERPIDLVDKDDFNMIRVMLDTDPSELREGETSDEDKKEKVEKENNIG